jgi:hypothetical protein
LITPGAGVVEDLSNELGPTAMTLLESNGRVERIPTGAGTLAWTNHSQLTATCRTFVLAEQDLKIEILNTTASFFS